MRKITKESVKAFKDAKNFKSSNTEVFDGGNGYIQFYLFWNLIASIRDGVLLVKDAGRRSKTTKERLNGILREFWLGSIYQKGTETKDGKITPKWYFVNKRGDTQERGDRMTFYL